MSAISGLSYNMGRDAVDEATEELHKKLAVKHFKEDINLEYIKKNTTTFSKKVLGIKDINYEHCKLFCIDGVDFKIQKPS